MNENRPKHLALHQIKFPLSAYVSILHRGSGILLFLSLPFLLWAFYASLNSIETYTRLMQILQHPLSRLLCFGLGWAFLYHFCAGIRYLLIDLHLTSTLAQSRASSRWVMGASLLLTVLIGVKLC